MTLKFGLLEISMVDGGESLEFSVTNSQNPNESFKAYLSKQEAEDVHRELQRLTTKMVK